MQGWRSKISSFADREVALFAKMLELEKHRQRAALKEGDESYVPDFVDVMLAAPVDDGKVFGDTYIIRQTAVRSIISQPRHQHVLPCVSKVDFPVPRHCLKAMFSPRCFLLMHRTLSNHLCFESEFDSVYSRSTFNLTPD